MSETLHIWVGTDPWQKRAGAEKVLEHSVRKHATCPVEFHWMRSGDAPHYAVSENGDPGTWKLGRPIDHAWPKRGWGTPFSCFRFAIPEMSGFSGRAVYMDADMVCLGDVRELRDRKLRKPWTCTGARSTDVSIIQCDAFRLDRDWPRIESMKPSSATTGAYVGMLHALGWIDPTLDPNWNCTDNGMRWTEQTRLLHFTVVPQQPYRPYPTVEYRQHPDKAWADRWFAELSEANGSAT